MCLSFYDAALAPVESDGRISLRKWNETQQRPKWLDSTREQPNKNESNFVFFFFFFVLVSGFGMEEETKNSNDKSRKREAGIYRRRWREKIIRKNTAEKRKREKKKRNIIYVYHREMYTVVTCDFFPFWFDFFFCVFSFFLFPFCLS